MMKFINDYDSYLIDNELNLFEQYINECNFELNQIDENILSLVKTKIMDKVKPLLDKAKSQFGKAKEAIKKKNEQLSKQYMKTKDKVLKSNILKNNQKLIEADIKKSNTELKALQMKLKDPNLTDDALKGLKSQIDIKNNAIVQLKNNAKNTKLEIQDMQKLIHSDQTTKNVAQKFMVGD